jgi:hypothetical protein
MFETKMNATNNQTERFVSIQGFFAFEYPSSWKNEIDEAGHYIFFNENGGSGVIRVMILPNEFTGPEAATNMSQEILNQNKDFGAHTLDDCRVPVVGFTKIHSINGSEFTVIYYAATSSNSTILLTYTVQTMMKEMDMSFVEQNDMIKLVRSFEWLSQ